MHWPSSILHSHNLLLYVPLWPQFISLKPVCGNCCLEHSEIFTAYLT